MSEAILDADSISPDETSSADSSSEEVGSIELFPEDTSNEPSESVGGHSESSSAEAFDPDTFDWTRGDPDTVPEQYQPVLRAVKNQQADYTRKMQDLADQRRQHQEQAQQVERMRNEWADRVQAVAAPQEPQYTPIEQLRAQSTDEENKAMDFMDFYVNQKTEDRFAQLERQNQMLMQRLERSEAAVGPIIDQSREQVVSRTNDAVAEAVEAYGEDVRNPKWTQEILKLLANNPDGSPHNNPITGNPYSVKEAYEKAAGITAQAANALRTADKRTRKGAKNAVRANASMDAGEDGSALTDNEVLARLQGLGFE
tara:strand:- start:1782 stop:2720 length:939 start_codon:yes stop_codon:yes gene_type:complete